MLGLSKDFHKLWTCKSGQGTDGFMCYHPMAASKFLTVLLLLIPFNLGWMFLADVRSLWSRVIVLLITKPQAYRLFSSFATHLVFQLLPMLDECLLFLLQRPNTQPNQGKCSGFVFPPMLAPVLFSKGDFSSLFKVRLHL